MKMEIVRTKNTPLLTVKKIKEEKLKELINDHWKYVSEVLATAGVDDKMIYQIGMHYRTAFAHGYKHGMEETDRMYLNTPY